MLAGAYFGLHPCPPATASYIVAAASGKQENKPFEDGLALDVLMVNNVRL